MNVKYQVFISSTFEDLQEERRVLMEQILNLGHIPVGMELFQASNQEQWSYIQKRILTCDYYLLIVAERYGSISASGKSYTELEYEFAVASGIPVAAFLLDSAVRRTRRADFVEHERKGEIDAFRALCSKSKMVKFWRDSLDLALKATNALLGLIEEEPRPGWIRAEHSAEAAYRKSATPPRASVSEPLLVETRPEPSQSTWTKVCGIDQSTQDEICYTTRDFVSRALSS